MIVKIVPTAAVELSKKLSDIRRSFLVWSNIKINLLTDELTKDKSLVFNPHFSNSEMLVLDAE
jgi:hypothetical protein